MRRDTVYSRMKRNGGFMAGRNHALLGSEDQMKASAMAHLEPDQDEEGRGLPVKPSDNDEDDEQNGPAPNYRPATGTSECGECVHYDEQVGCKMYGPPYGQPGMVCDSFQPEGDEESGNSPADAAAGVAPASDAIAY